MEEQTRPILALEYVRTESGLMGVQFPKGRWKRPHRERPCLETNHRFPTFVPISHPSAQNLSTFQPHYQESVHTRIEATWSTDSYERRESHHLSSVPSRSA